MTTPVWTLGPPITKWQIGGNLVLTIPAASLEYVRVPVQAVSNGVWLDPTADTVKMAFLATFDEPAAGDWKTATWNTVGGGLYQAQCLVGPTGTVTLTAGTWYLWVQITATPEAVVRQAGQLQVT